jgi:energy-coupling factor transporter ATP-binding protein EcfA2
MTETTTTTGSPTPSRSAELLRLRGVRFQYPGSRTWALDGVDLDVRGGEIVGVVGPNDAGKSTACLVASGLAPGVTGGKLEGDVELVGRPSSQLKPGETAQQCGVLFQQPRSQLSGTAPTVWEEIAFGPRNLGIPIEAIAERVARAVALLRIEHLLDRDPARLSGGQGQLVTFASVLALDPAVLVLDEPTSQLDPEGTRLVGEAIARAAVERGCGVLVVEHKTALLAAIADRIVVLGPGGRSVATGATNEILRSAALTDAGVEPPQGVRLAAAAASLPEAVAARVRAAIEAETPARRDGEARRS